MEQKKKTIGTMTYLVTQMDTLSALKIQTKIIKLLGAGIFGLVGKNAADKMETIKKYCLP